MVMNKEEKNDVNENLSNEEFVKSTVKELKELLNVKNFIGEAIETEDKVLIPFMKFGFGFGVGKGKSNENGGFGTASAVGVEPVSVVVVDKKTGETEGVRVLNISKGTVANKAISDLGVVITDLVKEVLAKEKDKKDKKESTKIDIESKDS